MKVPNIILRLDLSVVLSGPAFSWETSAHIWSFLKKRLYPPKVTLLDIASDIQNSMTHLTKLHLTEKLNGYDLTWEPTRIYIYCHFCF